MSEKAASRKAIAVIERVWLPLNSVRLDKCYNLRKNLRELLQDVEAFVLPKENLASFGLECRDVLTRIVDDLDGHRNQCFLRELSES